MQIFLSHSSAQKPLIREIRKGLPEHLGSWIDEERLLIGDELGASIEQTIRTESDYVLLFIDSHAVASPWVAKEIEWTLQAEKEHDRTILLPILIEDGAIAKINNVELRNRKYLRLKDYLETSVRALSESIASELFALVCRDVHRLRNPPPRTPAATLNEADSLLKEQASIIQKAVFPHRQNNPIAIEKLIEIVNAYSKVAMAADDFDELLSTAVQRNLVPGLMYDGYEAYLIEEHSRWKSEVYHQSKEKVGRRAAAFIKNGMSVFLDAGSTTEEIVRILCKRIETRATTKVTVASTSVNIADMISDCCVKMGFDDEFSAVRLYIPGGQIRPSTQAIVSAFPNDRSQVLTLGDAIGGFDLGFVGVNGVDLEEGFTTHQGKEASNKRDILAVCRTKVIVGDSSKVGLCLESRFASFSDDVRFIVNEDPLNDALWAIKDRHPEKLVLV